MGNICEYSTAEEYQYQHLVMDDGKSSAESCWKRWPREHRIAAFYRAKENPDMPDDKNKSYYAARARTVTPILAAFTLGSNRSSSSTSVCNCESLFNMFSSPSRQPECSSRLGVPLRAQRHSSCGEAVCKPRTRRPIAMITDMTVRARKGRASAHFKYPQSALAAALKRPPGRKRAAAARADRSPVREARSH